MRLSDISGNAQAKKMIFGAANGGAFHAYIITGPEGSGKKLAAGVLAAGLVCSSDQDRPCGHCHDCVKAGRGAHPDILTEHMEGKASFLAGQARKIRADAYIKPNEAARKVYILPDAAYMHPSAQNIMLKILEEPPEYAVFILVAENSGSLLETVRSRCLEISMKPVEPQEALSVLREKYPDTDPVLLKRAAQAGGGCIGRSIKALLGGTAGEIAGAEICRAAAAGDEAGIYRAFFSLERLGRDELARGLGTALGIMRDALAQKNGGRAEEYITYSDISAELSKKLPQKKLAGAVFALRDAYSQSSLYLAPGNMLAAAAATLYEELM